MKFAFGILVTSVLVCMIVFQNKLIYTCGSTKQQLPPEAFFLPGPQLKWNGAITSFNLGGSNKSIFFFHGNGIRTENTWWHIGRLFAVCHCNIHVIENLDCVQPNTWFGHSQHDITMHAFLLLKHVMQKNHTNIIFAVSLGTAVAMSAFEGLPVSKIVLENPFTSVGDLIAHHARVQFPHALIFRHWDTKHLMRSITQPLLILTSENDEIVPPKMSAVLFDAAENAATKYQVVLSGALHGHAGAHPEYLPEIAYFIE